MVANPEKKRGNYRIIQTDDAFLERCRPSTWGISRVNVEEEGGSKC